MNNDIEETLLEKIKFKIAISNCKKEINTNTDVHISKDKKNRRILLAKKKIIATVCASFVLVSGIVAASHMKNRKMIQEIRKIENIGVEVNIEKFDIDESSLTTNILLEFDDNGNDKINLNDVYSIELGDFIVRDEENRIIYCSSTKEVFEEYCKENNLDYTYGKFNENYMNCGLYDSIEYRKDNLVKLNYKIYTEDIFPKFENLYFTFETIKLRTGILNEEQIVHEIKGDWKFTFNTIEKAIS